MVEKNQNSNCDPTPAFAECKKCDRGKPKLTQCLDSRPYPHALLLSGFCYRRSKGSSVPYQASAPSLSEKMNRRCKINLLASHFPYSAKNEAVSARALAEGRGRDPRASHGDRQVSRPRFDSAWQQSSCSSLSPFRLRVSRLLGSLVRAPS